MRLEEELPGICNSLIEGYKNLLSRREFSYEARSRAEVAEYRKLIDNVAMFIDDELYANPAGAVSREELYTAYANYTEAAGSKPYSRESFFIRLRRIHKIGEERRQVNGKRQRYVTGVSLEAPAEF